MKNPQGTSHSIGERLKTFSLRSGTRQGSTLSLIFNIVLEVLARATGQEKERKVKLRSKKRKKEVKLFSFRSSIILYIENSTDSTNKTKICYNKFSTVAEYKINMQKQSEKEIKKTIPFTTA